MNELHKTPNTIQSCHSMLLGIKYHINTAPVQIIVNETRESFFKLLRLAVDTIGALCESTGAIKNKTNKLIRKARVIKRPIEDEFINKAVLFANNAKTGKIIAVMNAQRQAESLCAPPANTLIANTVNKHNIVPGITPKI
ncbi:MAG: hypothetical protein VR67_02470 [Peptococcaceae bacterium BRH_c8a]|nr:MAG: hypothetical protein VR67_02470 [Peptococcaceae bacterium BRH_c8a]